jgi:hypothetical protein
MKCFTYALRKFIREDGYLCCCRSNSFKFFVPHFLHADKLEGCTKSLMAALKKFIKEDGYFCCRKNNSFKFFVPYFLHAEKLEGCTQMTAAGPIGPWWYEAWCIITGKGYKFRRGDIDRKKIIKEKK